MLIYAEEIYGYETKNFNRQVKNNSERFVGGEFMFQLTREELEEFSLLEQLASVLFWEQQSSKPSLSKRNENSHGLSEKTRLQLRFFNIQKVLLL